MRHCSRPRRGQDFRNDPSSIHVIIVSTAVAAAIADWCRAHGVPGQRETSYSEKPKCHIQLAGHSEGMHLKLNS